MVPTRAAHSPGICTCATGNSIIDASKRANKHHIDGAIQRAGKNILDKEVSDAARQDKDTVCGFAEGCVPMTDERSYPDLSRRKVEECDQNIVS